MPQLTLYSYKKSEKREAPAQASLFDEKEKYVWDRATLDYFALDTSTPELFQQWLALNPPYCSIL
jgi:hypothetical protein